MRVAAVGEAGQVADGVRDDVAPFDRARRRFDGSTTGDDVLKDNQHTVAGPAAGNSAYVSTMR